MPGVRTEPTPTDPGAQLGTNRLLILSYLFPPAGGVAVQRSLSLAKYLPGCGFDVHVLRAHNAVIRDADYVAGAIFFCYNDYRTHVGDQGTGVMKQRVHGVVDLYGARKPSWQALRDEASPFESMEVTGAPPTLTVTLRTRRSVPSYTLRGYTVRAVIYGSAEIPVEHVEAALPILEPGQEATVTLHILEKSPVRAQIDVMRPTAFSAHTAPWRADFSRRGASAPLAAPQQKP